MQEPIYKDVGRQYDDISNQTIVLTSPPGNKHCNYIFVNEILKVSLKLMIYNLYVIITNHITLTHFIFVLKVGSTHPYAST